MDQIWAEISASIAMTGIAIGGVKMFATQLEMQTPPKENPDPEIFVGSGDPNDPSTRFHGKWRRSELLRESQEEGIVPRFLSQMWIVATASKWEHEWRPGLAEYVGVPMDALKSDLFGDLRLLRNDVVHNGGIASARSERRCKILRFEAGEHIHLHPEKFLIINQSFEVYLDPDEMVSPPSRRRTD